MTKTEPETFYTVAQIAEYLSVSKRTVRRWIEKRKLRAHRPGRLVRIPRSKLDAFLAACSDSPQTD
jgi:excisionase family DNA binding protein